MLCHGQAPVERGFNIIKEHLVENLQEDSLTGICSIDDFMTQCSEHPIKF